MTQFGPKDRDPNKPSTTRIVLWVVVGGAGLWLVLSGLFGMIAKG